MHRHMRAGCRTEQHLYTPPLPQLSRDLHVPHAALGAGSLQTPLRLWSCIFDVMIKQQLREGVVATSSDLYVAAATAALLTWVNAGLWQHLPALHNQPPSPAKHTHWYQIPPTNTHPCHKATAVCCEPCAVGASHIKSIHIPMPWQVSPLCMQATPPRSKYSWGRCKSWPQPSINVSTQ
jgi:hypothetical protein